MALLVDVPTLPLYSGLYESLGARVWGMGHLRLYDASGYWVIGTCEDVPEGIGWVASCDPADQALPHEVSTWRYFCQEQNAWVDSDKIEVKYQDPQSPVSAAHPPGMSKWCVVGGGGAVVRAELSLSSREIQQLPQGSLVTVLEVRGRRAKIAAPPGWVSVTAQTGEPIVAPMNANDSALSVVSTSPALSPRRTPHAAPSSLNGSLHAGPAAVGASDESLMHVVLPIRVQHEQRTPGHPPVRLPLSGSHHAADDAKLPSLPQSSAAASQLAVSQRQSASGAVRAPPSAAASHADKQVLGDSLSQHGAPGADASARSMVSVLDHEGNSVQPSGFVSVKDSTAAAAPHAQAHYPSAPAPQNRHTSVPSGHAQCVSAPLHASPSRSAAGSVADADALEADVPLVQAPRSVGDAAQPGAHPHYPSAPAPRQHHTSVPAQAYAASEPPQDRQSGLATQAVSPPSAAHTATGSLPHEQPHEQPQQQQTGDAHYPSAPVPQQHNTSVPTHTFPVSEPAQPRPYQSDHPQTAQRHTSQPSQHTSSPPQQDAAAEQGQEHEQATSAQRANGKRMSFDPKRASMGPFVPFNTPGQAALGDPTTEYLPAYHEVREPVTPQIAEYSAQVGGSAVNVQFISPQSEAHTPAAVPATLPQVQHTSPGAAHAATVLPPFHASLSRSDRSRSSAAPEAREVPEKPPLEHKPLPGTINLAGTWHVETKNCPQHADSCYTMEMQHHDRDGRLRGEYTRTSMGGPARPVKGQYNATWRIAEVKVEWAIGHVSTFQLHLDPEMGPDGAYTLRGAFVNDYDATKGEATVVVVPSHAALTKMYLDKSRAEPTLDLMDTTYSEVPLPVGVCAAWHNKNLSNTDVRMLQECIERDVVAALGISQGQLNVIGIGREAKLRIIAHEGGVPSRMLQERYESMEALGQLPLPETKAALQALELVYTHPTPESHLHPSLQEHTLVSGSPPGLPSPYSRKAGESDSSPLGNASPLAGVGSPLPFVYSGDLLTHMSGASSVSPLQESAMLARARCSPRRRNESNGDIEQRIREISQKRNALQGLNLVM
eukprot:Rhum_TRINITY_DN529_c0_g1::Rhum_TRINITY_DN529_c0_g1_i1::g.1515::m.1515